MEQISCDDAKTIWKSWEKRGEYSLGFTLAYRYGILLPQHYLHPKFILGQFMFSYVSFK